MRIPFLIGLLFLVAFASVNAQASDENAKDEFEESAKPSDTPSLPKEMQADVNPTMIEAPSLPTEEKKEEVDLLAQSEMPTVGEIRNDEEKSSEHTTPLPSNTKDDLKPTPSLTNDEQPKEEIVATTPEAQKEESVTTPKSEIDPSGPAENPLMSEPKPAVEEATIEPKLESSTKASEEKSTEDAFAPKSMESMDKEKSMDEVKPSTEEPILAETIDTSKLVKSTDAPKIEESTNEAKVEESTDVPKLPETTDMPKIEESTNEAKIKESTDVPKLSETTDVSKIEDSTKLPETLEQSTVFPDVDTKSTEMKMSSEATNLDPFQQGTPTLSTATEKSKEVEKMDEDTELGTKTQDTDLKTSAETLPVPVVKTESQEESKKPSEHSTDPSDLELKERPLVPIVREDEHFTTKQVDSIEVTTPAEVKEDKVEGPKMMSEEMTTKSQEAMTTIAMPIEDSTHEASLPAEVPVPVEPTHMPTSHMVSSGETHAPNESEEQKVMATNVPTQGDEVEKVTKSPADRPQFEEPKMEVTEKTLVEGEKMDSDMKEPEQFGHGTEAPSVPTAETHLMTTESGESDLKLMPTIETTVPKGSEEPKLDVAVTTSLPHDQSATESAHSTDEEGLFAGDDIHNMFANHHHEATSEAPKSSQEPKFAEEITEEDEKSKEPKAEPTAEPEPKAEPTAEPEPKAEPTAEPEPKAEPTAEPEPKAEPTVAKINENAPVSTPEPSAEPEPTVEPQPEPKAEPTAEPQPEPTAEPQPEPEPKAEPSPSEHVHHHHINAPETAVTDTVKTPFSLRFTNIDFTPEFNNLNSGAARKLHDQIYDDLSRVFENTLGDNYVGFELVSFRKGSVIAEGRLLSREELGDPSMVAAKLEDTLQKEGGRLGGNILDLKQVSIDGIVSRGSAQQDQASAAANTGYIVGGSIAIGVLIMAFIVFAVIVFGVNARRNKSRTLKLKEELSMAEHGRSPYGGVGNRQNGGGNGVNLMSYGNTSPSSANGHSTTTTAAANNSPMLLSNSQFTSPQAYQSSS